MSWEQIGSTTSQPQLVTGIEGLDTILNGGLFQGESYLLLGEPGTGKTVLANQLSFHQVRRQQRVLYVTTSGLEHARMIQRCAKFPFFDSEAIGRSLHYFSGSSALQDEGLPGLLRLIRHGIRDQQATLLILDGLPITRLFAESTLAFARFLQELQAYAAGKSCTLFLVSYPTEKAIPPEYALVDGVIELRAIRVGQRAARELLIPKFRSGSYLEGAHLFDITARGVEVYPRTEARYAAPSRPISASEGREPFGIEGLDRMLSGGLMSGSTTMMLGGPGSGKTPFGLHFLVAGAEAGQPSLHFGFYEPPARLLGKGGQLGLDLAGYMRQGKIDILWQPPIEHCLDRLAIRLLDAVEQQGVQRLFVDGLDGFQEAALYPERLVPFIIALSNELRARGVTTIFTVETQQLFGPAVETPFAGISAAVDAILLLRHVELRSRLERFISILKMRGSHYDPTLRAFELTSHGVELMESFQHVDALLTGVARVRPKGA